MYIDDESTGEHRSFESKGSQPYTREARNEEQSPMHDRVLLAAEMSRRKHPKVGLELQPTCHIAMVLCTYDMKRGGRAWSEYIWSRRV